MRIVSIFIIWIMTIATTANAQDADSRNLVYTESPQNYTLNLLNEMSAVGAKPFKDMLTGMGMLTPQFEVGLQTLDANIRRDAELNTVKIIEVRSTTDILQQVYAYSHFGKNAWFFWRLDFVKTTDGWALANFAYDSDYHTVLAAEFDSSELITP